MRFLFILALFFASLKVVAQVPSTQLIDPITSRVFDIGRYAEVNGTPFFKDEWMTGSIVVKAGRYNQLQLKIDLHKNELLFNKNEVSYEFVEDFKGVVLMPRPEDSSSYLYFMKGVTAQALKPDQFVQVLAFGKASFYRSDIELIAEMNEVNKGIVKYFNNSTRYYIQSGSQVVLVKPGRKEVIEAIGDKMDLLEAFCNEQKLNLKKEKEIVQLLEYYNKL